MLVAARGDDLIGDQRRAVHQIERLSGGHVGIGIDERDLPDDAAHLQREGRAGTDQSAAADNGDFHRGQEPGVSGQGRRRCSDVWCRDPLAVSRVVISPLWLTRPLLVL